jgi:Gpi18-like mannosyltransferase
MGDKVLTQEKTLPVLRPAREHSISAPPAWSLLALMLLLYSICIALAIDPLQDLAAHPVAGQLPGAALTSFGSWLPPRLLELLRNLLPFITPADLEFHILVLLLFAIGASVALIAWHWTGRLALRKLELFWCAALLLSGAILVIAPAMLSHDIFVYVGYGRVMVAHQANPYFVPLSAFPHDPFIPLDDWKQTIAAYGPLWLLICAAFSLLLGSNAAAYILAFRILGLLAHLFNMLLIGRILRNMGRSERVVAAGMVLYGFNPLILIESALGGHNDTLMMTLILLGLWWSARACSQQLGRPATYLPALAAFTLAALIKFTALLIIGLFIGLLLFHILRRSGEHALRSVLRTAGGPALRTLLLSLAAVAFLSLLAYLPFWWGHSPREIVISLTSPPSTSRDLGQFSVLRAIQEWFRYHPHSVRDWQGHLLALLARRRTWNVIDLVTLLIMLAVALLRLWQEPTLSRLAAGAVLVMGALLLVTPWFFPWYLAWLLALAPLALPRRGELLETALLIFTLVFSLSALAVYLSRGYQAAGGGWIGWMGLSTVAPPLVAFLLTLWFLGGRPLPFRKMGSKGMSLNGS